MSDSQRLFEESKDRYFAWLGEQGYTPRTGQLDMIQFISETLTKDTRKHGVVEAGTGTGKTVAYCIPAAIEARRLNKKLVIVTSTVLLQQQLVQGELEQLANLFSPVLTFGIIKGRRRYACIDRLHNHANKVSETTVDLFGNEEPSERDRRVANRLFDLFDTRNWDGDMDAAPISLYNRQITAFTTDFLGCHRNTCEYAGPCPYFRARSDVESLDVIVTNYSLLMASEQEGVDLLPEPQDCIYVFDEVHRLAEIVMNSFSSSTGTATALEFLESVESFINRLVSNVEDDHPLEAEHQQILRIVPQLRPLIEKLNPHFEQLTRSNEIERNDNGNVFRFPAGRVDDATSEQALVVDAGLGGLHEVLSDLRKELEQARSELAMWIPTDTLSRAFNTLNDLMRQLADIRSLFKDWGTTTERVAARWLSPDDDAWRLHSVPIAVSELLEESIWSRAYGVVCTSASIYASDGFDHFMAQVGLRTREDPAKRIPSPFDFRGNVRFQVPDMGFSRPGGDAFNAAAAAEIPRMLRQDRSGLVLFTSRRDMEDVHKKFPERFRNFCIKQGDVSMVETIKKHRNAIDEGSRSYLLGLASYREGVDLPGDYCQHVIIMRIPFSVPDDPVAKTQKDLLGLDNEFMEFDVPEASLRLFQACGRLLRNESDHGTISVMDRRIINARYRHQLLRPLPDFDMLDLRTD